MNSADAWIVKRPSPWRTDPRPIQKIAFRFPFPMTLCFRMKEDKGAKNGMVQKHPVSGDSQNHPRSFPHASGGSPEVAPGWIPARSMRE
jgi:hypothetical protein